MNNTPKYFLQTAPSTSDKDCSTWKLLPFCSFWKCLWKPEKSAIASKASSGPAGTMEICASHMKPGSSEAKAQSYITTISSISEWQKDVSETCKFPWCISISNPSCKVESTTIGFPHSWQAEPGEKLGDSWLCFGRLRWKFLQTSGFNNFDIISAPPFRGVLTSRDFK